MSSKPADTTSYDELLKKFGNTTVDRLRSVTRMYEKRLAAQTMSEQPLDELVDQVVKAQNAYIAELEARVRMLEAKEET